MNISLEWLVVIIALLIIGGLMALAGVVTHWIWRKLMWRQR